MADIISVDYCFICQEWRKRRTALFEESEDFTIIECFACDDILFTTKNHISEIDIEPKDRRPLRKKLFKFAKSVYGKDFFIDDVQTMNINHIHWHIRKQPNQMSHCERVLKRNINGRSKSRQAKTHHEKIRK